MLTAKLSTSSLQKTLLSSPFVRYRLFIILMKKLVLNFIEKMTLRKTLKACNWIKKRVAEEGHPTNFDRAVLIYRSDNPPVEGVPNSVVRHVGTTQHLAVAAHRETIQTLSDELVRLAE